MTTVPSAYKYQKPFWVLSSGCVVLVAFYMFFMIQTVSNTLSRQRAEKSISELNTNLSELEFSYLSLKASINENLAKERGFVDVKEALVAKSSSGAVSLKR